MAVVAPLLRRLRPWRRWALTVGLLVWFAALTRFEPSVLRATTMAGLAATAFALGRTASGVRLVALSVTGLVLVDPFLVWSVGFWLSVSATLGIVVLSTKVAAGLPGPRWLVVPVSVSVTAQLAVTPVSWAVFGLQAAWALPANVLAEPAAGFMMTYGLPAGLLAGLAPGPVAALLHGPNLVCVRWLRVVARAAAAADWAPVRTVGTLAQAGLVAWAVRRSSRRSAGGAGPAGAVPVGSAP